MTKRRLAVDPIACEGRGLCLELLPELVHSDDWGFPILADGAIPDALLPAARRAVATCPVLALRLAPVGDTRGRGPSAPGSGADGLAHPRGRTRGGTHGAP